MKNNIDEKIKLLSKLSTADFVFFFYGRKYQSVRGDHVITVGLFYMMQRSQKHCVKINGCIVIHNTWNI